MSLWSRQKRQARRGLPGFEDQFITCLDRLSLFNFIYAHGDLENAVTGEEGPVCFGLLRFGAEGDNFPPDHMRRPFRHALF